MSARTVLQHIFAIFGVLSNILLIILILRKSPKTFGSYKILMIYISIFEMLYAVLDFLVVSKMFSNGSAALIIVIASEAMLPRSLLLPANILYCTFFGSSMAVFAIHFIYRYLAVSGSKLIKNHNKKLIVFLLLFPILFGAHWYLLTYFTIGPFEEADLFIRKHYLDYQLSDIYYVGYFFYPEDAFGKTFINWKGIVGCSIESFFITVSFALIIYFGLKYHRHTKSLTKNCVNSSAHIKLQNQLFNALVFQTIIPLFLMHIPSTIGITTSFLSMSNQFLAEILSNTISLYPALDPLPNFFIIKSYRIAILGAFKKFLKFVSCRKQEVQVNVIRVQSKMDWSIHSKL